MFSISSLKRNKSIDFSKQMFYFNIESKFNLNQINRELNIKRKEHKFQNLV